MDRSLFAAIAVGLAVGGFLYAGLVRPIESGSVRRALAVASFALGGGIALWLQAHRGELDAILRDLTGRGVALAATVIGVAILSWRLRSSRS